MKIGFYIRIKRQELGMTQEELAEKMGYKSKSSINKIELGENDIPQSKVVKFAEVLHTTPAYLMGWDQEAIDKVAQVQEEVADYSYSNEDEIKNVMLEISDMGFNHSEIQRIRKYAQVLKETENAPDEVHEAFIELFVNMYKLNLSLDDVKHVYTYAQFLKSKK